MKKIFSHLIALLALTCLSACDPNQGVRVRNDNPGDSELLILVSRFSERQGPNDLQTDFRGSELRIYQKIKDNEYLPISTVYDVRTLSTCEESPSEFPESYFDTYLRSGREFEYGFVSIPARVYRASYVVEHHKYGDCFHLSDWNVPGVVYLEEPQTISSYDFGTKTGHQISTSYQKRDIFLHGTITRTWSFGDSKGCLNLWHDDTEMSDWSHFLRVYREHAPKEQTSIALAIIEGQHLESRDAIRIEFNEEKGFFYATIKI